MSETLRKALVDVNTNLANVNTKLVTVGEHLGLLTGYGALTFRDFRTLAQDATPGNLEVRYTAAAGGHIVLVAGNIRNADIVARQVEADVARVSDGQRMFYIIVNTGLSAGSSQAYPHNGTASQILGNTVPLGIDPGARIAARCVGVGATEDAEFSAVLRYIGATPTVAEVIS